MNSTIRKTCAELIIVASLLGAFIGLVPSASAEGEVVLRIAETTTGSADIVADVGDSVVMVVSAEGGAQAAGVQFELLYDPAVVSLRTVLEGDFGGIAIVNDTVSGVVTAALARADAVSVSPVALITFNFEVMGDPSDFTALTFPVENVRIVDAGLNDLEFEILNGSISIAALEESSQDSGSGGSGGGGARIAPEIGFRPESLTFTAIVGEGDPDPQTIQVFTLRDRSVLRFTIEDDSPWLRANPIEGLSDATNDREQITVSVLITDLGPGTYAGLITISARRARNDPQTVPVTLIVEAPLGPEVISRTRSSIASGLESQIVTPDNRIQVTVPQGALADDGDDDRTVEIELKDIEVSSLPDAPGDTVIVRAIELNTLVNGEVTPTDYEEPVELVFVLTEADLALVEGDTSRLGVLWFNDETGEWESIEVTYDEEPPPAGSLVALLDHFSVYAIGVMEEAEPEAPVPVATATPLPTVEPTATSVPTAVPTPTARAVETSTAVSATPTVVVVAQMAPTPAPSATPRPTATAVPPAPALPAAPAPPSQPPTEPQAPPVLDDTGGIGTTTIVILVVVGIAVLVGIGVVAQGLRVRRREV